jgi:hypothetical protein
MDKNEAIRKVKLAAVVIAVAIVLVLLLSPFDVTASDALSPPAFPKVARASDTSLKLTWHRVEGASGYQIFRYDSKSKKYRNVATVSGGNKKGYRDKNLRTGRLYTYKIRSYRQNGSGRTVSAFTYRVSAIPYNKKSRIVNAGSVLRGSGAMEIGLKQISKVDVAAAPSKYGTAIGKRVVDKKIRILPFSSSFISQSGNEIVGKDIGSANVYAIAHNGNVKKVRVSVIDCAKPTSWKNLDKARKAGELIADNEEDVIAVFSYLERHSENESMITLDENGDVVVDGGLDISEIKDSVLNILGYPGLIRTFIYVSPEYVQFIFREYNDGPPISYDLVFCIPRDPTDEEFEDSEVIVRIANHWFVSIMYYPA